MQPHKIAIIQRFLPSGSRGGVGYFTHNLANILIARGHHVTVFSLDTAPEEARYQVVTLPTTKRCCGLPTAPITFPFQIARQDFSLFDVIHAQGDDQWLSHDRSPPVVRTLHGSALSEAFHNGIRLGSPKWFLMHLYFYLNEIPAVLRADRVVAVSNATRRHYPKTDATIPNGVDTTVFKPAGVKSSHPTILFVGDLEGRKRGRLLLETFQKEIQPSLPDAELWVVRGDKVDTEGVRWFGRVDTNKLAWLYREAWVFCLPSIYEGFGIPYVEAMASGTPVVATPNAGAQEVLDHGRAGLIVSDAELGVTLRRVLTDATLRAEYRERGLDRAKQFAWDVVAAQYEKLYESVLH